MGANCCVAAKEKRLPDTSFLEVSNHRNVRHSPSWSFRWDNRTHIEDIINNPAHASHNYYNNSTSGNSGPEIKSEVTTETDGLSDRASPFNDLQTRKWQKSHRFGSGMQKADILGRSIGSNSSPETAKSPGSARASDAKLTVAMPPNPSSSAFRGDPSSSRSRSLPSDPTSSRKARRSPGFQLSRQISDSRIPSLKSLNENSSPEGRQSCMLSVCSNDFSAGGSHDGSSDGWSMRTFTELVASSRRDRWSFDSENFLYNNSRGTKFDGQQSMAESPGPKTCKICSKQLKERSPWSAQKIVSTNELPVVAILVCDHVYHADCLENMTHGGESYDPLCPICTYGEEYVTKLFGKVEKARSKISRIAVVDPDADQDTFSDHQERTGKVPRMGTSSSMKRPFSRPFLQLYFSIGVGRPSRSQLESESSMKKSFWPRHRRG